jgi:mRNA interferase YafQ
MYRIFRTKDFEKSYERLKRSGTLKTKTRANLIEAIDFLSEGKPLPLGYKDHALKGDLKEFRECHIKGDLLLVYQIREKELVLVLVDIGTHSYLFGS